MKIKTGLVFFGGIVALSLFSMVGCGDDTKETTGGATTNPTTTSTGGDGGNGGTGGEGGNGGTGGEGGAAASLTCDYYCTAVMDSCTGAVAQYSSKESCMGSCKALPAGTLQDTSTNTLGCRIYHAGVAKGSPDMHCTHAGPGGDDNCGKNCEGFCAIALSACTEGNSQYADNDACMAECMAFPTAEKYDAGDDDGDSFACRLYHLTVAATEGGAMAATHCPHITKTSTTCAAK